MLLVGLLSLSSIVEAASFSGVGAFLGFARLLLWSVRGRKSLPTMARFGGAVSCVSSIPSFFFFLRVGFTLRPIVWLCSYVIMSMSSLFYLVPLGLFNLPIRETSRTNYHLGIVYTARVNYSALEPILIRWGNPLATRFSIIL